MQWRVFFPVLRSPNGQKYVDMQTHWAGFNCVNEIKLFLFLSCVLTFELERDKNKLWTTFHTVGRT